MPAPTSEPIDLHSESHTIRIRGRKPAKKLEVIERSPCVNYGDWMARYTTDASGIGEKNNRTGLPATDKINEQQGSPDSDDVSAPRGGDKDESPATVDITDYGRDNYFISLRFSSIVMEEEVLELCNTVSTNSRLRPIRSTSPSNYAALHLHALSVLKIFGKLILFENSIAVTFSMPHALTNGLQSAVHAVQSAKWIAVIPISIVGLIGSAVPYWESARSCYHTAHCANSKTKVLSDHASKFQS